MRGTKGFPKTGGTDAGGAANAAGAVGPAGAVDTAGSVGPVGTAPATGADDRSGWFVLHGGAASAVAALLSYQLAVIIVADGAMNARPSVNFAGLVVGLAAGVWTVIVGLLVWPLLNAQATRRARWHAAHPEPVRTAHGAPAVVPTSARAARRAALLADPQARAIRRRGFSALHIVAIGTAVPWIVLSLLLGSWQATTITIVVAVVAGTAGGIAAARRVWRPNRMRVARPRQGSRARATAAIGPALERLPAAGGDRRPVAFRSPGAHPSGAPDDVESLSGRGADRERGPSY